MAHQKRAAQEALQFGDPPAERGGRDIPPLGSPGDAARLADEDEEVEGPEIDLP